MQQMSGQIQDRLAAGAGGEKDGQELRCRELVGAMLRQSLARSIGGRQILDGRRILRRVGGFWVDGNERLAQSGRLAFVVAPRYAMPPCRQDGS